MTTDLARRSDRDILEYLGLPPNSVNARATVLVCKRYGLDPLLGHLEIVKNKIYITRDGMLHVAHQSGQLNGIVVDEERRNTTDDGWTAYVSVHRRDMDYPFRYGGQCKDNEQKDDPQAMALARAERRALRRAFDIPAYDDGDEPLETGHEEHIMLPAHGAQDHYACSCGQVFSTMAGFHAHKNPGPAPTPPPTAAVPTGAAGPPQPAPAGPGPKPKTKHTNRERVPDYVYDQLPESQGF